MVRLMYQLKCVLKYRETMLKNSKVVLFLSPKKVGSGRNLLYPTTYAVVSPFFSL
jgi:hypothetical protein